MKEETYKKALNKHQEQIAGYADKLYDITFDMLGNGLSANDVIGMLDNMKMFVFYKTINMPRTDEVEDNIKRIKEIIDMFKEEQCQ